MTNKQALDKLLSYIDRDDLYRDLELNEAVQTLSQKTKSSSEAFNRIKEHCLGTGNSPYKAYTNSYEPMGKDLESIEKELEILEILKKHIYSSDSSMSILLDDLRYFKDFKKIKEWLENEK